MALVSIATFNANNFYLRYKFARAYPGGEQNAAAVVSATETRLGYLPGLSFGKYGSEQFVIWDPARRELASRALKAPDGRLPDRARATKNGACWLMDGEAGSGRLRDGVATAARVTGIA